MTKHEAVIIWEVYQDQLLAANLQDAQIEAAGFPNPKLAERLDREFWNEIYTPEFARALNSQEVGK